MDLMAFLQSYGKEGIFLALYIWTLINQDKKNTARETSLQSQLDKTSEQLSNSIEALNKFDSNFQVLDAKIDKLAEAQKINVVAPVTTQNTPTAPQN